MFKFMAPHCIVQDSCISVQLGYDLKVCLFLQVKAVGEEMGIGFLGLGFQPKWALSDIPIMPKVILSFNLVYFFLTLFLFLDC
jgi:hypothetical protein